MNFEEKYKKEVVKELMKRRNHSSPLAVPKIMKITVNTGVGRVKEDKDREAIAKNLALITGQKLVARLAKKAIASFKTREGMTIGYSATLRGKRMYDFLTRLISVALARTRDFRGLSEKSVDEKGNMTIGIREHIVFPEIIGEDVKNIFGLSVTLTTRARSRDEALEMYKLLGIPFQK